MPEFKRWIVEQAQLRGMSLAGLAMSNQVNANQLRRWVQLHGKRGEVPCAVASLLPVTIAAAQPTAVAAPSAGVAVEIEVAGAVIRVRDGVGASTLRMVLSCLLRGATP